MEPEEGTPLWRLQKLPPEQGAGVRGLGRAWEEHGKAGSEQFFLGTMAV